MNSAFFYEGVSDDNSVDFAITQDDKGYVVDVFDASIEDSKLAYIDTFYFESLKEAKADMAIYQHRTQ